ncbi:MAG TPA: hypothetical protein VHM48_11735, partial [Candidatus Limnocylindrales bacterium]|nr:hypothetical protein [Candidatus Limnocylindrales bacterium]
MDHSITARGTRGRKLLVLTMAFSLTLAASGAADAAYSYSNATRIYACVNKVSKVARIVVPVNGKPACHPWEALVS